MKEKTHAWDAAEQLDTPWQSLLISPRRLPAATRHCSPRREATSNCATDKASVEDVLQAAEFLFGIRPGNET